MAKGKKSSVTDVDFVKAAVAGKSVAEVAATLKLTPNAVYTRIKALTAKGVKLPSYERQGRVKDVTGLNALIASLTGDNAEVAETTETVEVVA
jgi:transposase